MKTKHTPGPWWFSKNDNSILADPIGMMKLAKIHPINQNNSGKANGTLMAASPELLEALQKSTDDMKWLLNSIKQLIPGTYLTESTIANNEALIKKATE